METPLDLSSKKVTDAKNIIFDLGGVLMDHNLEGCLRTFRQFMPDEDIENVLGLGNNKPNTLRAKFETRSGDSPEWFVREVLKRCRQGTTEQQVIDAWNIIHAEITEEKWETVRLFRQKGYHTYLLSNTDRIHWEHTLSFYGERIEQLFDATFLSFNYWKAKPDPDIFKEVDRFIQADPKQTYFVDDTESNRQAAEQTAGWHTCANIHELKELLF